MLTTASTEHSLLCQGLQKLINECDDHATALMKGQQVFSDKEIPILLEAYQARKTQIQALQKKINNGCFLIPTATPFVRTEILQWIEKKNSWFVYKCKQDDLHLTDIAGLITDFMTTGYQELSTSNQQPVTSN